jgi:hypothetical protein
MEGSGYGRRPENRGSQGSRTLHKRLLQKLLGANVNSSLTEVSWILRPLDKASLGCCVTDQTIPLMGMTDVMLGKDG